MMESDWKALTRSSEYEFVDIEKIDPKIGDLVTKGADLKPSTLINAYSKGYFPMVLGDDIENKMLGWFSPVARGVIPLDEFRISKSMKRSYKKFTCTIDKQFEEVMRGCMDTPRKHGWINESFIESYVALYNKGLAHSIEVYYANELVGGLYGVSFGRFFAGESMFSLMSDASKVALMELVEHLNKESGTLLDTQWLTGHLASLGGIEVTRMQYIQMLNKAISLPSMNWT